MQRSSLPGESSIAQWSNLTLSTHRVWATHREAGTDAIRSMPIDAIESVGIDRRHQPVLLLVAALCALFALMLLGVGPSDRAGAVFALLLLAVIFAALYFAGRKVGVEIFAGSARITAAIGGSAANVEEAMRFLDAVEAQSIAVRRSLDASAMPRHSGHFGLQNG